MTSSNSMKPDKNQPLPGKERHLLYFSTAITAISAILYTLYTFIYLLPSKFVSIHEPSRFGGDTGVWDAPELAVFLLICISLSAVITGVIAFATKRKKYTLTLILVLLHSFVASYGILLYGVNMLDDLFNNVWLNVAVIVFCAIGAFYGVVKVLNVSLGAHARR